jgi:hypothetical protein
VSFRDPRRTLLSVLEWLSIIETLLLRVALLIILVMALVKLIEWQMNDHIPTSRGTPPAGAHARD